MMERKQALDALALVGFGCRLPGGVRDVDSFWQMLVDGRSGITEVPDDRWNSDRYYHPDPAVPGRMFTKRGGFVDQLKSFDAAFWGISPREAMRMDPQQRWLLETAWEAIEDAGVAPNSLRGGNVGVFVGISTHDYGSLQHDDLSRHDVHTNSGGTLSIAANRISYLFDFKGPSAAVDTACSSALVAVTLACRGIWSGQCDCALAGGVNALITPHAFIGFSKASMLSPTGECFAFDERANGYVRGEGAGVAFLKPLDQALEDGNPIYAVIRSAVVNQDGHTSSMTVPGVESQSEMLRLAYQEANVPPEHVIYMEAHGTGTPVGDPIELKALGSVLSQGRSERESCLVGSVKTNIGHLEPGSGIAGLLKTALVLDRGMVPPSLNFRTPNPKIPFDQLKLKVASELQPLPRRIGVTPVAAVNSFGFGGTNAHVVLEAAPPRSSREYAKPREADRPFVLPISARDDVSLRDYAKAYRKSLEDESLEVSDFCYSAGARKEHHDERLVVVGRDARELRVRLDAWLRGSDQLEGIVAGREDVEGGPIVFVFTGQGPQWWAMGRQLFERESIVRQTISEISEILQGIGGWSLVKEMTRPEEQSNINQTTIAQPAIFALQVALAELWKSWGIKPDRVVGHSMGEVAAAHCAGIFSLQDAVQLIYHRSRLQDTTAGHGRMLATGLKPSQVRDAIGDFVDQVQLTAINSPDLVTLAGDTRPLETIAAKLEAEGRFMRWLRVNYAFHTHQMEPIKDELLNALAGLQPGPSRIPFVSTVTGKVHPGERLDAMYWWRNVRQPVLFGPAISNLVNAGERRFLEIGPHPALRSSINACLAAQGTKGAVFHSLARHTDEPLEMLTNLAGLHIASADIDWAAVNQSAGNFVRQPTYPWHYETYWLDSGEMASRLDPPLHPLLGTRITAAKPTWQFKLDPRLFPYLDDHRIWEDIVFPAAGYAEIGLAVAHELFPEESYVVEEVESVKALFASEEAVPTVQVVFDEDGKSYSVYSSTSGKDWELNARGRLVKRVPVTKSPRVDLSDVRSTLSDHVDHEKLYEELHALGYGFGPSFSQIQHVWRTAGEALVEITVPEGVAESSGDYHFQPAVLDACFQATFGAWDLTMESASASFFYLPESVRRVRLFCDKLPTRLWAHARQKVNDGKSIVCDVLVYDEQGQCLAEILGFCLTRAERKRASDDVENCVYQFQWESRRLRGSGLQGTCQFPSSMDIIAGARPQSHAMYDEYQLRDYYREFVPRLSRIARQSVQNACVQLGWDFCVGDHLTSEEFIEKLDIVAEHHQLARAELHWLEVAGILEPDNDGWRVVRCPEEVDFKDELNALADEFPKYASEIALHQATAPQLAAVLSGRVDPLDLLFPAGSNDLLEDFYTQGGDFPAYHRLIQQAVSNVVASLPPRRAIRILEVGAGTGSLTRDVLKALPDDRTEYLFTDIGASFVTSARTRFADCPYVEYQTFDVERDPAAQDIQIHGYDLILATNVLHATSDLRQTLANIQKCLATGGMLMFLETVTPCARLDNIFGLMKGWWKYTDHDLRSSSPLISRQDWESLLTDAGFKDVRSVICSPDEREIEQSVLVAFGPELCASNTAEETANPSEQETDGLAIRPTSTRPYLVFADESGVARSLVNELQQRGETATQLRLGNAFRQLNETEFELVDGSADELRHVFESTLIKDAGARAIVHCWSLDRTDAISMTCDLLLDSQTSGVLSGLNLARVLAEAEMPDAPRVYFLTRGAQPVLNSDPTNGVASSPLVGLCRVANNEHDRFRWTLIDLDERRGEFELDNLLDEITLDNEETEVAYRNDRRYVNRLRRVRLEDIPQRRCNARRTDGSVVSFRLQTRKPGTLSNLSLNETQRRTPGSNEIEVRVQAGGINFRDVMKALGMYPGNPVDLLWFGDDFSGVVERVGSNVQDLQPGDRVVGLAPYCFRSHVTVDRQMVFKQPAEMTFEQAATLPTVYLTAHYAINHLARMEPGEKILIHAGSGGVGQAAIQIAKQIGLEIFATAGTPEKRQMLKDIGVPHVMDSRTLDFADQIMEITGGAGVDAVLNSLAGEFIPKSLSVLAPFGRFLEIGKIDIYGNSKLGLAALKENISYHVIDLGQLILEQPSRVMAIFDQLRPRFDSGEYAPLTHKIFPITEVVEAFRYMAQGKHIGKNVLSFNEDSISIGPCTEDGHLLRSDASYLITGGSGGFGLEVSKWMAKQGARNLVLMSRSGPRDQAAADIEELRAEGVNVLDVRGDVTRQDDVQRVIEQIQSDCLPLKGVVHAAMVLDDDFLAELDEDRFNRVLHPKMVGAWKLHVATREIPLEHFVCFSSLSAVIGATKQSNYNAGNCFLDALACHRRALGLPALTLNWGAILGAGFVERNRKTAEYLDTVGLKSLHVDEALRMYREMIQRSEPLIAVGRVDWRQLGKLSPAVGNLRTYAPVAHDRTDSRAGVSLTRQLMAALPSDRLAIVEDYLAKQVAGVFGIETAKVDRTTPLTNLGLDSLMAVELMNRIESETGTNIPMGGVLNGPNVQELAQTVLDLLIDSTDTSEDTGEETSRSGNTLIPLEKAKTPVAGFPLTVGQRTKLHESQNVACTAIIHEKVDTAKLREAYLSILDRHPMLRTTITDMDGELIQQVRASDECDIAESDANGSNYQQLSSLIANHINRPFNIEADPLTRLGLFRCGDESDVVVLSNHPTVADSSSTSIAFRDLLEDYGARCAGRSSDTAPERFTYQDFAEWQQTLLASDTDGRAIDYWIDQLSGAPIDVDLPTDKTRQGEKSYRKCSLGFELDDDLTLRLLALSAEHNVSLRDMLYAAFAALVHRRTNQGDILIGYRFDGRSHDELCRVVGQFENWLPTRSQLEMNSTFRDFLIETNRCLTTGYENQHVPLTRLLDRLDMQRGADHESLLQIAFAMSQDGLAGDSGYSPFQIGRHGHTLDLEDVSIETIDVHGTCESSNGPAPLFGCDLSLEVGESCGRMLGWWHYNRDLLEPETIEQMNDMFRQLLEAVVKNPAQYVSDLLPQMGPSLRVVSPDDNHVRRVTSRTKASHIDFELESRLDPEITPSGNPPVKDCENPRLFLTGATGFIGAYLLVELLNRTSSEIVCLVRAADEADGLRRIRENLAGYDLAASDLENRVSVIIGDFSQPLFGLTQDEFDRLSADVDVLYHNGADVNLALPYAALRSANVLGTREVLRLACHIRTKPTHMVSTFTVHTTDSNRGRVVTETDPLPACEDLLYGYSQTKWVSERMIDAARDRGLPVAIYRPGHVIGDSQTGTSNTNDLLHTLVLTCMRLGAAPKRDVELDLTPVNFVACAIADLSLRKGSLGKAFHLTNPNPLKMRVLMNWVQALQLDVDFVPDEMWRNLLLDSAEQVPVRADEIRVLADIIVPRALADKDAHALHPVFDCSRATTTLATSGIRCAPADETLLQTCLEYLQRTGVAANLVKSDAA